MFTGGGYLGKAAAAAAVASLLTFGGTAYSPVMAAGNDDTDTLTNQMVSRTRGNTQAGDFTSYDHPDRNLIINWTNDSRGDGAAIRDADVTAKNITINTDFQGNQWTDKGVISDVSTHIKASGDINIKSHDDGVFTEGTGITTIEGFKNLIIKSTENGYGLVDNGGGITVNGGQGSTVDITSFGRPGIGNSEWSFWDGGEGKGITINADAIKISSEAGSISSGTGKNHSQFTVSLNAPVIDLHGVIGAVEGDVFLNSNTDGVVKVSDEEVGSIYIANGSKVTINEHAKGGVQLDGKIEAGSGSSVLANMTGDGSYLSTPGTNNFNKDAVEVYGNTAEGEPEEISTVTLNMTGDNSYIKGDMKARDKGKLIIHVTGNNFSMSRSYQNPSGYSANDGLLVAESGGTTDILVDGESGSGVGDILARFKGNVNLAMTGKHAAWTGNMKTAWDYTMPFDYMSTEDQGAIQADFSGAYAKMTGDIQALTSKSSITANFSGPNSSLKGDVKSLGEYALGKIYDDNVVNLNMTGDYAAHTGNLVAEGNNTLNAAYTGQHSLLTGNVVNSGIMNLTLDNQSVMNGNIVNSTKSYNQNQTFDGQLKTEFKNGSLWNGNLDVDSGTASVSLQNSSWNGAAKGNGDISLTGRSLWQMTDDSAARSVDVNAGSVVFLAGAAKKLEVQKLGGSGGQFLMDLKYGNDDVDSYRNGSSDFLVAHDGSGSTYQIGMTPDSSVSGMKDGSKLYFASTKADTSAFTMNQAVQIQNYNKIYNKNLVVKKETDASDDNFKGYDDWFLTTDASKGTNGNTINTNGIIPGSAYNAAFALWRDDDTLLKRLGELRYNQDDQGIWARFTNKRLERDGHHGFEGNFKTLQVGLDKEKKTAHHGSWYYGGAVSHLWGNTDYEQGHGSQKATDFTFYGTNLRPQGHYLDLVARVGRIDSDYDSAYGDHGSFQNWGSSIGAEYGRKKTLRNGWSLEPQAQLTYNYLWGDDYTTRNGARVHQDNADSLVGRLGFVLGREFHENAKNPSRVYLKASVLHDFLGDTTSRISDDLTYTDTDDLGDTWYVVGIGTNIQFADNTQFYFDAEKSFCADVDMKYRFNAGIRFEF